MPLFIAHRGLLNGPDPDNENTLTTLSIARYKQFDVEVDIWYQDQKLYVGHDRPQYEITTETLKSLAVSNFDDECHVWIHCKNIPAVQVFNELSMYVFNFFYHESDAIALTNTGRLWTYPGKQLTSNSICVLPETTYALWEMPSLYCYGFCSDRVNTLRDLFSSSMSVQTDKGWR